MNYSFRIGSLFGISVKVHLIFILLFGLLLGQTFYTDGFELGLWFGTRFLLLFTVVLLHELGHSLAAKAHGIRVYDIILWPLGGIARLAQLPKSPGAELRIAVAGPCVNFLLVLLLAPVQLLATGDLLFFRHAGFQDWSLPEFMLFINVAMGCFNLIPAFPLDGGRIFRALLATRLPFLKATQISVFVGRLIALAGGTVSLFHPNYLGVAFIAVFVWILGEQELRQAVERDRLERAANMGLPLYWPGADIGGPRSTAAMRFLDPGGTRDAGSDRRGTNR